ncbi:hypothetical protein BHM03_00052293 [Ensete ventricosum]|nr:hypothetical protein BHM03_00052293 [Ensete ventricosum]
MDFSYATCFSLSSSASRGLLSPAAAPAPHSVTLPCPEYDAVPRILAMVLCFLVIATIFYLAFAGPDSEEEDEDVEELRGVKTPKPRGLDPAVLASLPVKPHAEVAGEGTVGPECAVCLAEFGGGDAVRVMAGCGHGFHADCIDPWLAGHATCPVCRSDLAAACHVIAVGG